jgi:hydroxysqualene synthase
VLFQRIVRRCAPDEGEGTTGAPCATDGPRGGRAGAGPEPWLSPAAGACDLREAQAYCESFARAHSEIYPMVARYVPAEIRPHLLAVYAFARMADDFADEPEHEGHRYEALDHWQEQLYRCFHREAEHPIFVALNEAVDRCGLALPPFEALLTGLRMDIEVRRYDVFDGLLQFTSQCAQPVGRIILGVFGYHDPMLVNHADEVSTALQLTTFWRDVGVDALADRIYIPAEDLHVFGVAEADVKARRSTSAMRDLMRFEVARTHAFYQRGRPLLSHLGDDLRVPISLIWEAGTNILERIERADFDVFAADVAAGG